MQVWSFEQAVFEVEGIRIAVRAPANAAVGDFEYRRCAAGNTMLSDWLANRITPLVNGYEVVVINGRGEVYPHGRTHMATLRDTYAVS